MVKIFLVVIWCSFSFYSSCFATEKIILNSPIEIIPIHGNPFKVKSIIIGNSKVIQYITTEGTESFISESNVKNINEFRSLVDSAKLGFDERKTKKMSYYGREIDRLDVEIKQEEKKLKEELDRIRRGK